MINQSAHNIWKTEFSLAALCAIPALWVMFFVHYPIIQIPLHFQWAIFSAAFVAVWFILGGVRVEFSLELCDLKALGIFAVILLLSHSRGLSLSLGGDELYHAEMATFHLKAVRSIAEGWPALSRAEYYSSIWKLFDLRHVMVTDVASLFAAIFWVIALIWIAVYVRLRDSFLGRSILVWTTYGTLAVIGIVCGFSEGLAHPPLRLLPWFVGTLLFGLNEFAFRIPALLTCLCIAFLAYRALHRELKGPLAWGLSVLFGLLVAFVPVVFYVGEAVEASVYGWAAWMAVLFFCLRAMDPCEETPERWLVFAGAAVSFGAVTRQPVIMAWLCVLVSAGYVVIQRKTRLSLLLVLRIFAWALLLLPYFLTASKLGHPAAVDPKSPALFERLIDAVHSGVLFLTTLNSTTLPWVLVALAALPLAVAAGRLRLILLLVASLPTWVLYFSIKDYLWGVGRYQAEYVAPFLSLIFFFAFSSQRSAVARLLACGLVVLLSMSSWMVNARVTDDINYRDWPRLRISTTAYLPYREALSYLHREQVGGQFIIIGGQPWYGDMALWLSGHSYSETRLWRQHQDGIRGKVSNPASIEAEGLYAILKESGLRWVVIQGGTKREYQHRDAWTTRVTELIESTWKFSPAVRDRRSFSDAFGGTLDLYRLR